MDQSNTQADELEVVMRQYSDMVYRVAYTQTNCVSDAEDIYQEVFLQYVKKHPAFASEEHRKAWLLRVTINGCKKLWRSAWQRKTILTEIVPANCNIAPEHLYLLEALKQIPLKDRTVLHLFYYEDLTTQQIAQLLGRRESIVAYLTMQDLEADRLDDSVDLYNYNIKGYTTFTHRQISYNAEQKKALLELSAFCGDNTATVGKTTLSVQSFLTGQQKYENIPVDLQLAENPATTTAEIHGGSGDLYEQLIQRREGWYATATVLQTGEQQKIRDDINFFYITGAGFVDGRLHIQTYWTPSADNHGYIGLRQSNGEVLYFSSLQYTTDEQWGDGNPHSKYIEYVWDITPEELTDCTFFADLWADDTYLEGNWRVTFPSDTLRTIELNGKDLSALDAPIQRMEISPLGVTLTGNKDYLQGLQYTLSEDKHTLLLIHNSSDGSSHTWSDGNNSKLQLPASEFIDIDLLQQVQVEDISIALPR